MIDILREERKQNHAKCSVKTSEGKKKKRETQKKHKQKQVTNSVTN